MFRTLGGYVGIVECKAEAVNLKEAEGEQQLQVLAHQTVTAALMETLLHPVAANLCYCHSSTHSEALVETQFSCVVRRLVFKPTRLLECNTGCK